VRGTLGPDGRGRAVRGAHAHPINFYSAEINIFSPFGDWVCTVTAPDDGCQGRCGGVPVTAPRPPAIVPQDVLITSTGFQLGVNYGWNKVRVPAPVPAGSRVRARAEVVSVDEVGGGWWQVVTRFTVEVEGLEKPCCLADCVGRALEAAPAE